MENYKICVCGDKEIKITEDTHIRTRQAKDDDIIAFENAHWFHPEQCPIDRIFWGKLVGLLNSKESYSAENLKYHMYSSTKDYKTHRGNFPAHFIFNHNAIILKYSVDMPDPPSTTKKVSGSRSFHYPMGFNELLTRLVEFLDAEKNNKTFFRKKPIPMTDGSKKIDVLLNEYSEYISQFQTFVETTKQNISNSDRYKKHLKKLYDNETMVDLKLVKKYSVLEIDEEVFLEGHCGFDIQKKVREISNIKTDLRNIRCEKEKQERAEEQEKARQAEKERLQKEAEAAQKAQNSDDPGEKEVEYTLKWFLAETDFKVVPIKKICESEYRYNCIMLKKPDFIDEPQEYDHILVSEAGVFIIETKHWKGRVEIRPDGKWVRDKNNDGHIEGVASPITQMKRHEALVKKILPDTPIYSLLCFSHSELILDGAEYCKDFRVIYVEQLNEVLTEILSSPKTHSVDIEKTVKEIEKHMVNIMAQSLDR